MSRIYFHAHSLAVPDVALSGSERAYAANLIGHYFTEAMEMGEDHPNYTRYHLARGTITYQGQALPLFDVACNTAMYRGNNTIRLLTRLHAQCELHAYVEEENRTWLARLIDEGRTQGILRPNMGWEEIAFRLRDLKVAGPIVTSFSVTEAFPDADAADCDWKEWDELTYNQRWGRGIAALRAHPEYLLELKPDNWYSVRFGAGISAAQLKGA